MDRFDELLNELGKVLGVALHIDKHNACRLNINNFIHIQLEQDIMKDRVLFACYLCDIPPGKFREIVLKEALKANYIYPRLGTFAYAERNNKLTLFDYLPIPGLNGEKMASFLFQFIEKASTWKQAVESGTTPSPAIEPLATGFSIYDIKK